MHENKLHKIFNIEKIHYDFQKKKKWTLTLPIHQR